MEYLYKSLLISHILYRFSKTDNSIEGNNLL